LAQMQSLDSAFHFTQTGNSEVADLWYIMAVAADYKPAYGNMEAFLSQVGRRKFLTPLYSEMMKSDKGKAMAKQFFGKYKQNYHPIAQETIEKLLQK
jgi:leukotriene-A4 hydrolase